ncbi:hypothetical protein SELMODRAFT_415453 [Selaginella moellendorffii]|uniref:Uncharacterized protein n=1 Tax=Selaginella moellendorffii TaxID=88036 RepID=D8RW58_SELML|nr:hypothetical protein SELMODRAFT_415453 [Selaginella moellendorffii]
MPHAKDRSQDINKLEAVKPEAHQSLGDNISGQMLRAQVFHFLWLTEKETRRFLSHLAADIVSKAERAEKKVDAVNKRDKEYGIYPIERFRYDRDGFSIEYDSRCNQQETVLVMSATGV